MLLDDVGGKLHLFRNRPLYLLHLKVSYSKNIRNGKMKVGFFLFSNLLIESFIYFVLLVLLSGLCYLVRKTWARAGWWWWRRGRWSLGTTKRRRAPIPCCRVCGDNTTQPAGDSSSPTSTSTPSNTTKTVQLKIMATN